MKVFGTILKILAAIAAVAGIAYVVMKYGDAIVTWIKEKLGLDCCCDCCCCDDDCCCDEDCCDLVEEDGAAETVEAEEKDFEG